MVPVIIAGVSLGLGPSLCSAIVGALAFNFFLTEPRYSLVVDDPANIWAIGLLFVVGLIVSGVAFTSRQRATEAALLRRQAAVLQGYSRDVIVADNTNAIVSITSQALAAIFQVPVVVMLVAEGRVVSVEKSWRRRTPGGRTGGGAIVPGDWNCHPQRCLPDHHALTFGLWRQPKARRP